MPGDQRHVALNGHVQIDLEMIPTIIDPLFYFEFEDDQLISINGSSDDELLRDRAD